MKRLLYGLLAAVALASPLAAQNSGSMAPEIFPVFLLANGTTPAALGFVCTTATGGSTALATYRDAALSSLNQNPIRLSAAGRPINGVTLAPIYLQAASYRFTLYAAGTGNTCDGTTVGTMIWQQDGVYDLAQLFTASFATKLDDKVCHASQYTGTTPDNAGGKIAACVAVLPAAGGTIDARGLEGAQTVSSTVSITKPVKLLVCGSTFSFSAGFSSTTAFEVEGCGTDQTIFSQTSNSVTVISHAAVSALKVHGVTFLGLPQTSGAAITIAGSGGTENEGSIIQDIECSEQWVCVNGTSATVMNITKNNIHGIQSMGVQIANSINQDSSVGNITDNLFSCSTPTNHTAIKHLSGGSINVTGNDFLECDHSYWMLWSSNTNSSQSIISNNRFDLGSVDHIKLDRVGANTGTFSGVIITGNYFNSDVTRPAIPIWFPDTTTDFVYFPVIVGNHIQLNTAGGVFGVLMSGANGDAGLIHSNNIYGQGTTGGLSIGAGITELQVGINNILVGSGSNVYTATLRGVYIPDNTFIGAPNNGLTLTERVLIGNNDCYAARNAAGNAQNELLCQDASDIVQIARSGQNVTFGASITNVKGTEFSTTNICTVASVADAANCAGAAAGRTTILAGSVSTVVTTTAMNSNSQIFVVWDQSIGTALGVTCNTTPTLLYINQRGADFFTVTSVSAPAANPLCLSYFIVN